MPELRPVVVPCSVANLLKREAFQGLAMSLWRLIFLTIPLGLSFSSGFIYLMFLFRTLQNVLKIHRAPFETWQCLIRPERHATLLRQLTFDVERGRVFERINERACPVHFRRAQENFLVE
jgi:hypothetical protein